MLAQQTVAGTTVTVARELLAPVLQQMAVTAAAAAMQGAPEAADLVLALPPALPTTLALLAELDHRHRQPAGLALRSLISE